VLANGGESSRGLSPTYSLYEHFNKFNAFAEAAEVSVLLAACALCSYATEEQAGEKQFA